MKKEIIDISKNVGIDIIGFCDLKNLVVFYDKYELQETLGYKCSFQVGDITDKDLSNEKYSSFNTGIVVGVSYKKIDLSDKFKVSFSSCSQGIDYHILVRDKLLNIESYLLDKGYSSKIFVDNNALDERMLAYNAGLGFYGKNNLLINEKLGSYFFIGVLLTDAVIESDKIIESKCGDCGLCVNVCPFKAINENGILNANKCMSYINQKKTLDEEFISGFDNCIYGCDRCISVCPYNKNVDVINGLHEPDEILNMSDDEYSKIYKNNASFWRGKKVIDRNINIYLNNLKNK